MKANFVFSDTIDKELYYKCPNSWQYIMLCLVELLRFGFITILWMLSPTEKKISPQLFLLKHQRIANLSGNFEQCFVSQNLCMFRILFCLKDQFKNFAKQCICFVTVCSVIWLMFECSVFESEILC